jgi:hypothetical protein
MKRTRRRATRSLTNAFADRVRRAYRTPIPDTTNSSGIPHSDPHARKTLNPALGCGSFTNHDVPQANTTAEWKTISPATTNARMKSSSALRSDAGVIGAASFDCSVAELPSRHCKAAASVDVPSFLAAFSSIRGSP